MPEATLEQRVTVLEETVRELQDAMKTCVSPPRIGWTV